MISPTLLSSLSNRKFPVDTFDTKCRDRTHRDCGKVVVWTRENRKTEV
jgi:hypothetical protein